MPDLPELQTVYIVDDDPQVRRAVAALVRSVALQARTFESSAEFLSEYDPSVPGCLVLDVRMPGMTGIELQKHLIQQGMQLPTIILTAHGEIQMATAAIRSGAVDFLEKPFSPNVLLERIREALQRDARSRQQRERDEAIQQRLDRLSTREREVADLMVDGLNSRQIGAQLEISHKTVDNHRGNIFEKLKVENVAQLSALILAWRHAHPLRQ